MSERHTVVVVGGGQAGLSMSWCLKERGIGHVVLERNSVGWEWSERRWDSFCLVTPNWQCKLPGFDYSGGDPHGFMQRDEIVSYIRSYADSFAPPVREGVEVTRVAPEDSGFVIETSAGSLDADAVVVATGGYHEPRIPRLAERLPESLHQIHSSQYVNPDSVPAGDVLVVGTGQSGSQVAEDLHLAGRGVHLCVGGAPRVARFYRGRDVTDWLDDMGHYDLPVDEHPSGERIRLQANHYVTGRDGGHDIDLRRFKLEGMELYGRVTAVADGKLLFADDLAENLDHADEVSESIKSTIDEHISKEGIEAPEEESYSPLWTPSGSGPVELDLETAGVRSVVWCTGFTRDYGWVEAPAFDGRGYPTHDRGVTSVDGLMFIGLPWMHTWGSGRFSGVARDAEHLASVLASRTGAEARAAA